MKEYIKEEDDSDDFNNVSEEKNDFNYNQIISPFKENENSTINNINNNNNIEPKEEPSMYKNIFQNKNIFEDNINSNNDNLQFMRYPLNDEEKRILTPRNTSLIYKLLDYLFNW